MSTDDYPTPSVDVGSVTPRSLWADIRTGEPVTLLDVRSEGEFEEWHIDGDRVDVTNIPYYEFIEGIDGGLLDRVPTADPLVIVCAKGGASAYVAGLLIEEGRDAVNLADGMNGWAEIYASFAFDLDGGPTVLQYQRPSSGCLGYLVVDGDEAAVVDPLRHFADRYPADAADQGAHLTTVIDSHIHADHLSGLRTVSADTAARTVLPASAIHRGVTFEVDEAIEDGEALTVGETTIEAVHTPGHTTGMTSFLVDDRVLLTGDSLFVESVARPDLERGAAGQEDFAATLYDTLHERILPLPDDTLVAPGHSSDAAEPNPDGTYTATVGRLRDGMAALQMDRQEFISFIVADMPPRPANFETIIATNLGQEDVDDEEAFRLELGPNNCAASSGALTGD